MHWLLDPITKHYVDFSGRATRQQFWMFILLHTIISMALVTVGILLFTATGRFPTVLYMVWGILALGTFLPSLAISVRRLRDAGFSGWLILIALIPYVGGLILLVLYCLPTKVVAVAAVASTGTPEVSQPISTSPAE